MTNINQQEYEAQIERLKNYEKLSRKKKYIDEYIDSLNNCKLNYLEVCENKAPIYLDDELYSDKVRLAVLNVFEEVIKQLNVEIEIL